MRTLLVSLRLLLVLAGAIGAVGCSSDDAPLEAFEQHLCTLTTAPDGRVDTLWLDNGAHYAVAGSVNTARPQDTLRVLAYFVRQDDGFVRLGRTTIVPTLRPYVLGDSISTYTAPIHVASAWRSGHYINTRLDIPSHNEVQTFRLGFSHTVRHINGTQTAVLRLYRKPTDALEAYTRTLYLSLDLRPLATTLQMGRDSVAVVVQTTPAPHAESVRYTFVF